jgi:class 3 adenylate cyclase/tetratricopeptide (TPR) repeat protein
LAAPAGQPLERRLVSVLFCDLVSFTAFSEGRDPEDVREVLGPYFSTARQVIGAYGGTIEKFIGDAVMAVWGAPVAREDDAQRAVRAALELVAAVKGLSSRLSIPELRVRIGVLTGEASVEVGQVQEGMVVGDAVNTASRIQSLADPGTVLVDEVTRLACERSIAFETHGAHDVKGKSNPVRTWRALSVLSGQSERGRGGAIEPPLVGRKRELRILVEALDRVVAARGGAHLVTVIGEAGVGKSRLVREFERHANDIDASVAWHRASAFSFGGGAAFAPLAEMVRTRAEIEHGDSPERQLERIASQLDDLFADQSSERERVQRAVHRLLGLDDGRRLIETGELFSSWRSLIGAIAERRPAVLVFEELQESDPALLDFVAHLIEWGRFPLLVVAAGRPDPRLHTLVANERVELGPLTPDEIDALVSGTVSAAPEPLLITIRADSGGVPLYAVETLRALADLGVLAVEEGHYTMRGEVGQIAVPPTVRALIASRLDGLGATQRKILSGGAVIGEWFTLHAAASVGGVDVLDAAALLDGLVTKAFLAIDDDGPSGPHDRYRFLQGVVRRVALSALSRRERKRFHLAAADYLAEHDGDPERAGQLAGHLLAALEADPKAVDVTVLEARAQTALRAAAERSAAVGALADALALFDRAAELTTDEHERASVFERAGLVASRAGEGDAAAGRYRAAAELHAAAGRVREQLAARAHELRSLQYARPPAELLPQLRALDEALSGQDDHAGALAAATLAYTLYQLSRNEEALVVATRGVRIAETCRDWGELLHALGQQGAALAELQRPDEAIAIYRRALDLAVVHEPRLVAVLSTNVSISLASVGRYREAAAGAREAIVAADRSAERMAERWGRLVLGRALCSLGDWNQAIAEIESVKDQVPTLAGMAFAPLVVIALGRGQNALARELVAEHDRCRDDAGASGLESDFRSLRTLVLTTDAVSLGRIVPEAEISEFAEWSSWLPPIIDRLVAGSDNEPLEDALAALGTTAAMKQTAPVRAQAERLAGHLSARAGDRSGADEAFARAHQLAAGCELAFDAAVIGLEHLEQTGAEPDCGLANIRATLGRLGANPWLDRAEQAGDHQPASARSISSRHPPHPTG